MKNEKLIVALDVPSIKEAERLVKTLSPSVKVFKIGKELFTSEGPGIVKRVHKLGGKVFLDLKFHDIPNTVASACAAAARLGVFMMNVHALGGRNMLTEAARAVRDTSVGARSPRPKKGGMTPPLLLGVTVLTSMSDTDLKEVGIQKKSADEVVALAKLCKECGLDGVVASGQEIEMIRKAVGKKFLIVTPGVRPSGSSAGDQKRTVTPLEAIQKGADFIVVGRPITKDPKPRDAAKKILSEL